MVTEYNSIVSGGSYKLLDSRFEAPFKQGHIPSAVNMPFVKLLNQDKTFKSDDQIVEMFKTQAGMSDPINDQVVSSC